ncbi:MAG: ABC transporter substrate-binding protein [Eubacteriales bacterium]
MNKLKIILIVVVCASLLAGLLYIVNTKSKIPAFIGSPIKIGLIGPWTGSSAQNGLSMKKGAELAVENINNTGGVNGRELLLLEYDDKGSPSECLAGIKQLAVADGVTAIIGPFNSSCAMAIMDLVDILEVPLITPVAMSDEINLKDDYIFRNTLGIREADNKTNAFSDFANGKYIMLDGFGGKSIGILWQNDVWGYQMQTTVVNDLKKIKKLDALTFSEPFELGQTDFSKIYKEYGANLPDVIYVVALNKEAIQIVSQGRKAGFQGLYYGEGGFNIDSFDKELGELANGCLFSTQWHPSFSTPMSDLFMKLYTEKYDDIPDMFAAISYEAMYILDNSLVKTSDLYGRDNYTKYLRDSLAMTRNFSGVTGNITFDNLGQCDRPVFIMQKRWSGHEIQSVIIYPKKYSQSDSILTFNFEKMFEQN